MNAYRTITWQQVALVAIMVAGTLAAYKFLGDAAAGAVSAFMGLLLAASKGGEPPAPPGDLAKKVAGAVTGAFLFGSVALGCAASAPDAGVLVHDGFFHGYCQQVGRLAKADAGGGEAGNAAGWAAYDACERLDGGAE